MTPTGAGDPLPQGEDLRRAAEALAALSRQTSSDDPHLRLQMLVELAAQLVGGAASITVLRQGRFRTVAASHADALEVDLLQYRLGVGPCIDAVLEDSTFVSGDLEHETRWQPLGKHLHAEHGVSSMMAFRLGLLDDSDAIAALNFSSHDLDAFSRADVDLALLLATHCAFLLTAAQSQVRADNLRKALESNREIGVAMGILMHRYQMTREHAFDALSVASQDSNRKLADVAGDVVHTGTLSIRRWAKPDPDD